MAAIGYRRDRTCHLKNGFFFSIVVKFVHCFVREPALTFDLLGKHQLLMWSLISKNYKNVQYAHQIFRLHFLPGPLENFYYNFLLLLEAGVKSLCLKFGARKRAKREL